MFGSMRRALTLLIVLAILPLLLAQVGVYGLWGHSRRSLDRLSNRAVAQAVGMAFAEFVHDVRRQTLAIGLALDWDRPPAPEWLSRFLSANARDFPAVRGWYLIDAQGKTIASTDPQWVGRPFEAGAAWRRELSAGRKWVLTDTLPHRPVHQPSFIIARRIEDEEARLLGVCAAEVDATRLGPLFRHIELSEGGMLGMADRQGNLVYIAPEIEVGDRRFLLTDPVLADALRTGQPATGTFLSAVDHRQRLASRIPVPELGWVAGSSRPTEVLRAPVMRNLWFIGLANLLAIGLSLAAASGLAGQMLRSLRTLQTHSMAVGQGDLTQRTKADGIQELEELADSFNLMGVRLQEARAAQEQANAALEQRVAERTAELREANRVLEREIKERQRSQATLQEQSRVLEAFFEHTMGPILFINKDLRFLRVNEACVRSFHKLFGGFSTHFPVDRLSQESRVEFEQAIRASEPREAFGRPLFSVEHPELGATYWNWSLVPVLDGCGEVDFWIFSLQDVTERKATQDRLRENEEKLRAIFDHTFQFVGLLTPEGNIVEANRGALDAVGLEKSAVVGKAFCDTPWWQHSALMRNKLRAAVRAAAQGQFVRFVATHPRPDGSLVYVDFSLTPVRDERGEVVFLIPEGRDITQRIAAEEELAKYRDHLEELVSQRTVEFGLANQRLEAEIVQRRQAAEALERATKDLLRSNQELEQFAYVASHDLQEPLLVITGYLQLLERRYQGRFDQDADQFIQYATDGSKRMQQLISDLLEYSRVGRRSREFASTDMEAVLQEALDGLARRIEETGAVVTHDPLPAVVADRAQLVRLLQNLLGNAMTFHGERRPEIHVSAQRDGQQWRFSVRDNGIGIERQYWDQIFVVFQRLHTRQKYAGTGIGLAICKKIVERHGGRIWLDSEPGQGSTFYFTV